MKIQYIICYILYITYCILKWFTIYKYYIFNIPYLWGSFLHIFGHIHSNKIKVSARQLRQIYYKQDYMHVLWLFEFENNLLWWIMCVINGDKTNLWSWMYKSQSLSLQLKSRHFHKVKSVWARLLRSSTFSPS